MSEAAVRDRAGKQHWAEPGGRHDRLIRFAKIALPSAVGVLIAVLAIAPLERDSEVSFILDKKRVDNAPERMRVEAARYSGEDNRGQKFTLSAENAVQRRSDIPVVDIGGMIARLALIQGPLLVAADRGRYDLDTQKVDIDGTVRVAGPDGYRLTARDVTVDLKQNSLISGGLVEGEMRLGRFTAGRMRADLGDRTVVLDQGVRLKIVQGAVR